jgi:hypothetical protein
MTARSTDCGVALGLCPLHSPGAAFLDLEFEDPSRYILGLSGNLFVAMSRGGRFLRHAARVQALRRAALVPSSRRIVAAADPPEPVFFPAQDIRGPRHSGAF